MSTSTPTDTTTEEISTSTFGSRLKAMLVATWGTQLEMSSALKVQTGLLQKYFADTTRPGVTFLEKLAQTGISLDWLISGTGSPYAMNEQGDRLRTLHAERNVSVDVKN